MRSSACDTVSRLCARPVLCWLAFPSASALGSTGSAADRSALFVGFPATVAESRLPTSVHHRLRLLAFPVRTRQSTCRWSVVGSPGSRARSFRTCQCLRPRRAVWALAISRPSVLPSVSGTTSAPGMRVLSRLNGWPMRSPVNASQLPSRATAHELGVDSVRYSFIVMDFHHLLLAGLPAHSALPPIATKKRTCRIGRFVPEAEMILKHTRTARERQAGLARRSRCFDSNLVAVADQVAVLIADPMANGRRLTAVDRADAAARGSVIAANGAHLLDDIRLGEAWPGTCWSGRRAGTRSGRKRNERNSRGSGEIQSHGSNLSVVAAAIWSDAASRGNEIIEATLIVGPAQGASTSECEHSNAGAAISGYRRLASFADMGATRCRVPR